MHNTHGDTHPTTQSPRRGDPGLATRTIPAGAYLVSNAQPTARMIRNLLDPKTEQSAEFIKKQEERRVAMEQATRGTGVDVSRTPDDQLKVNIPSDLSFDTGSATIKPQLRTVLDPFAASLKDDPKAQLSIIGHTDGTGSEAVNNPLSVERAQSVRDYLAARPFGTATAEDLFDALSAVSGQDVKRVMQPYLDTPGAPRIAFERLADGKFRLSQRRYTVLGSAPETGGPWIVPVRMRIGRADGTTEVRTVLVDEASVDVDLGGMHTFGMLVEFRWPV